MVYNPPMPSRNDYIYFKAMPGTTAEISRRTGRYPANVSRKLRKLEEEGLVEKEGSEWVWVGKSPEDHITPPQNSIWDQFIEPLLRQLEQEELKELTYEELKEWFLENRDEAFKAMYHFFLLAHYESPIYPKPKVKNS